MKIFWIILYVSKDRSRIKNIKIDARDYTSQEMKKLIYQEFDLDYDTNLRLRNNQNCLIPINMHIEANTKKNPYILEVYKLQRNSQKNTGMVKSRPVTHRPEVLFNLYHFIIIFIFMKVTFFFKKREATAFAVRIVISQYLNRLNKIEDLIDLKHKLLKESFHKVRSIFNFLII